MKPVTHIRVSIYLSAKTPPRSSRHQSPTVPRLCGCCTVFRTRARGVVSAPPRTGHGRKRPQMAGPLGSRGTGGRSGSAPSPRATQSPTVPRLCGHCTRFQDPCPGCSFRPPPANGGRQQLGPVVRGALLMRRTARPNCRMLALSLATPNNFLTVFTPPPCAITALCASDIRKRLGDFWGVPSEGPAFMPHEV